MTRSLRCAVMIPAGEAERVSKALDIARIVGLGPFSEVVECPLEGGDFDRYEAGLRAAQVHGADWILWLDIGEVPRPDAFILAAPALRIHDVLWGAASLYDGDLEVEHVLRKSRLACQSYEDVFHLALNWWIGNSYFIKTALAVQNTPLADTLSWRMQLFLSLWKAFKCLKTAQPLTIRQKPVPDLDEHEGEYLRQVLDRDPIYCPIHGGAQICKLPYTGRNPVIEREHTRGLFYEQDELTYLASRIRTGATIVDIGANTGNHTVYFAHVMEARKVIPIEPSPQAIQALERAVAINHLTTVDLSKLGVGVGREAGTFRLQLSQRGGLGATSLAVDPAGDVRVVPVDTLIQEPVDVLKIDVESMEMSVLEGAKALIAQSRPLIFIEIADPNTAAFLTWIDVHGYRIEKIFPDKMHANYLLAPHRVGAVENWGGCDV